MTNQNKLSLTLQTKWGFLHYDRFCSHRFRDSQPLQFLRLFGRNRRSAQRRDRRYILFTHPARTQLLQLLEHPRPRPMLYRYRRCAHLPRRVGTCRAPHRRSAPRSPQLPVRRRMPPRRLPRLSHGLPRLPLPRYPQSLAPPAATSAQSPTPNRSLSLRLPAHQPPSRPRRRRSLRLDSTRAVVMEVFTFSQRCNDISIDHCQSEWR